MTGRRNSGRDATWKRRALVSKKNGGIFEAEDRVI